jgi:hypothetical protein
MDDETKAAFAAIDARFDALMARMNNQHERLINIITSLHTDFANTKGFLIGDALVLGRRVRTIEDRLDDLERGA